MLKLLGQSTSSDGLHITTTGNGNEYYAIKVATGGDSSAFNVTNAGKVGIGVAAPRVQTEIQGAAQATANISDSGNSKGTLQVSDTTNGVNAGGTILFAAKNDLGTYTPQAAIKSLLQNGTLQGIGDLAFSTRNATSDTTLTERMRITSTGDVLISKTAASFTTQGIELRDNGQINVAGTVDEFNFYNTSANVYRFFVTAAGAIHATSTSINAISDITLKENIKPLETGLNEVMKLQPRRFDWKNGDGKNIAGFVAQEVEEVLPDLVSDYKYTDEETKKSLKMGDMIPTLVKAIQELRAEIELLKNK